MITLDDIHSARARLQGITTRTPLIEFDPAASKPGMPHVSASLRDMGSPSPTPTAASS